MVTEGRVGCVGVGCRHSLSPAVGREGGGGLYRSESEMPLLTVLSFIELPLCPIVVLNSKLTFFPIECSFGGESLWTLSNCGI